MRARVRIKFYLNTGIGRGIRSCLIDQTYLLVVGLVTVVATDGDILVVG